MTVYYDEGDAIEGKQIIAITQKYVYKGLIQKSNQHRGHEFTLKKWAHCRINKAIEPVRKKQ
jgi:hypothetical protein